MVENILDVEYDGERLLWLMDDPYYRTFTLLTTHSPVFKLVIPEHKPSIPDE